MKEQILSDKQRRAKRIYGTGCYTYILYILFGFKHIGGYKE